MLASDMNNREFVGAVNPDDVLHVNFYMKSLLNEFESEKEGRKIYYELPFIQIMTPGNQLNIIDTPVREEHKYRFPRQWSMFQNSQSTEQVVGTPVTEWPTIGRSQAEELKALKFFTVEQIANASDAQIQKVGMNAMVLRQKAQAFITLAKDSALEQKQAAEIERKNQEIKELNERVARMEQMVQAIAPKPKRAYTKRAKVEPTETE